MLYTSIVFVGNIKHLGKKFSSRLNNVNKYSFFCWHVSPADTIFSRWKNKVILFEVQVYVLWTFPIEFVDMPCRDTGLRHVFNKMWHRRFISKQCIWFTRSCNPIFIDNDHISHLLICAHIGACVIQCGPAWHAFSLISSFSSRNILMPLSSLTSFRNGNGIQWSKLWQLSYLIFQISPEEKDRGSKES